jgi:acyl-CoA synthetase (AMP-forming)/AMP-acid ligase II
MRGINLATYLEHSAMAHPEKVALIFDEKKYTFSQINEKANAIANGLVNLGLKKGGHETQILMISTFYCIVMSNAQMM